jgi:hypothetical protein
VVIEALLPIAMWAGTSLLLTLLINYTLQLAFGFKSELMHGLILCLCWVWVLLMAAFLLMVVQEWTS